MNSLTQSLNAWVTCPTPRPHAKLRLFCFHYAGGGALSFRNWSAELPATIEVCPIQLPGREKRLREPAFTRLEPLIQALTSSILPFLDQPFACFGHSMGGLIAFELARHIRRHYGLHPSHLFISGCRAPQIPRIELPIHALPDAEFLEELRRLNGTPEAVIADTELMKLLLPTLRADFALNETYIYQNEPPLDCPITVFGGLQDPDINRDQLAAWRSQTRAAFSLHMLPGDHFFLHQERSLLVKLLFAEYTQSIGIKDLQC